MLLTVTPSRVQIAKYKYIFPKGKKLNMLDLFKISLLIVFILLRRLKNIEFALPAMYGFAPW